ncbi:LOW QUALITY PROTEIN: dynein axonemal heavy chain 11 [Leptosomus discolor]
MEVILAYEEKQRGQWGFDRPAQAALTVSQIWWVSGVEMALNRLEEGLASALKDCHEKQVTSFGAFGWLPQLRHRWADTQQHCFANVCDAQFQYFLKSSGNTPWLVITPLTDGCYIILTQSLHITTSGASAEAAGAGKTETIKDLGCALGMMVYVFSCSEEMDYKSVVNTYKGLIQTGAWGCFDEFGCVSLEVLSMVAVLVKTIHDAVGNKRRRSSFLAENITLKSPAGIFITMNPGYAGRTELPQKLKALFRQVPCAVVVPDIELISEIMWVAEGFVDSCLLARKFITLLCRELLSKQDHCDWALCAIKSFAGSLKGDEKRPEDQVLKLARDFNLPKIVTDDIPVLMGLISDLFPALDVPRKGNLQFEQMVKQSTLELHLQPEESFILKVVQLEEVLAACHMFVVGNAGPGKSKVLIVLHHVYMNMKQKPIWNDLNPKVQTADELFGFTHRATEARKDGNPILEAPRGYALLVGVGGSGKQSSRLAAYIYSLEVFQITLKKDYRIQDLRVNLASLYVKTVAKNMPTVFLLTDAQVPDECFLVLINDLLASGEIPDLFSDEDMEGVATGVRRGVALGLMDTSESCWGSFLSRVRLQLKIILCFSPAGAVVGAGARNFPAIVKCTAIDWFHEWPWEALRSISRRFIEEAKGVEVEDLKSKFASQEAELQLRNQDAEALIAKIGFQTEKVSQEKALADAEEQKVYCEVGPKCVLAQANAELAAATEKLEAIKKKLLPRWVIIFHSDSKVPVPVTGGLGPIATLTDDAPIAAGSNEGLPSDRMSTANATVLTDCECWPLVIDPQPQGIKWVKDKYGADLKVVRLGQKGFLKTIKRALAYGDVLIENMGESIDPILDPQLGRHTVKKAKYIETEDKECEFNKIFCLILHTKLANPHHKPELQVQTTLIDFMVPRNGLEDQLLAEVVSAERPDLEKRTLWRKSLESTRMDLARSYPESSPATRVRFILSPGVDPLEDIKALGKKLGFTTGSGRFRNISLGQGQEVVAKEALEKTARHGHWVLFQNIHLVAKWLGTLKKMLEQHSEDSHPDFCVFISAEPAPAPEGYIIPQGIKTGLKLPPTGMPANLHAALNSFEEDTLELRTREGEFKSILFSLCYFHTCVAGRLEFGPQGWDGWYPFGARDLIVCLSVLCNCLETRRKGYRSSRAVQRTRRLDTGPAVMQSMAHKNNWPLDKVCLTADVTKKSKDDDHPQREGAYICENTEGGTQLKELTPALPVIFVRAIPADRREIKNVYECPVDKTKSRGPAYVGLSI